MFTPRFSSALSATRPAASRAIRAYATGQANENRVAGGLKATLHNPNVSQEAKDRAAERLEEMSDHVPAASSSASSKSAPNSSDQHKNNVLGGYKATLSNPRTSDEAKKHAREILEADGYHANSPDGIAADEHDNRVIAGYKAALHNPRVSSEAKQHAKEYLQEHGAL
ncbi:hypothetical protein PYCCODRAFT_1472116 [Trametes coccinea BRFM310]|uniref:Conidiation protein 6 n=1 Tax=Trametes coccinea (strain BRFM310) TaxID=1353009 RepID=A0A1Y2I7G4_TRAC3|nr:hypothetical protein PYCCODRAFT_1472116 [Trametes coccinea BRFM310]